MGNWEVFETIVYIVGFLAVVIPMAVSQAKVIQKNTDAINGLTRELRETTSNNKKEHEYFFSSVNTLKQDVAVLKEKHDADVKILKEHFKK